MQITFRLPSKAVSYGYVEMTGDHREFGFDDDEITSQNIATTYATFIAAYWGSEVVATENITKSRHELIKSELGGKVVSEDTNEVIAEALAKGYDGPVGNPERTQIAKEIVDATDLKPWEQKTEAQPKPWERPAGVIIPSEPAASKATPKVANIEF